MRALLLLALAGLGVACKPAALAGPKAPDGGAASGTEPSPSGSTPAGTDAPPECASEGSPWDGKAEGCLYEHAGCCYPSPEALCAAAGCAADACRILESSPAQARCD